MLPNRARFWNVRLIPISTIRCGGILRMLRPSIEISPATEAVKQRCLASAVRPDQPEELARREIKRHAVERHDAPKADCDIADC
jgi:hypothetical protein